MKAAVLGDTMFCGTNNKNIISKMFKRNIFITLIILCTTLPQSYAADGNKNDSKLTSQPVIEITLDTSDPKAIIDDKAAQIAEKEAEKLKQRAEKEKLKKKKSAEKAEKARLKAEKEALKKQRAEKKARDKADKEALKKKKAAEKAEKARKKAEKARLKAEKEALKKQRAEEKAREKAEKKALKKKKAAKKAAQKAEKARLKAAKALLKAQKLRDKNSRLFFDQVPRSKVLTDLGHGLSTTVAIGAGATATNNLDLAEKDDETNTGQVSASLIVKYQPDENITLYAAANTNSATSKLNEDDFKTTTGMALGKVRLSYSFNNKKGELTIGRFAISDRRTWAIASVIDGVHLRYREKEWEGEIAVIQPIKGPEAQYAFAHFQKNSLVEDALTGVYAFLRKGIRDEEEDNQVNVGAYIEGKGPWDTSYWGNIGFSRGKTNEQKTQGYAVDLGVSKAFNTLPLKPSFSVSAAHSYGNIENGEQVGYRDTGISANKAKTGAYYGGILNPKLDNLTVIRATAAINPTRSFGILIAYQAYWQNQLSDAPLNAKLKYNPNGEDRFLGQGIDLLASWKIFPGAKIGVNGGIFFSSSANTKTTEPATTIGIKASYAF